MPAFAFCPFCATPLAADPVDPHRPQRCAGCGATHYHNSKPCAGALILSDQRVLLAERAFEPFRGYWDIPGGFLEPGEHPSDGARREAHEETGLVIDLAEQPFAILIDRYGGDGDFTLNLYYLGTVVSGDLRPADDAASLRWFPLDALPERIAFEHSQAVLRKLRDHQQGGVASRATPPC